VVDEGTLPGEKSASGGADAPAGNRVPGGNPGGFTDFRTRNETQPAWRGHGLEQNFVTEGVTLVVGLTVGLAIVAIGLASVLGKGAQEGGRYVFTSIAVGLGLSAGNES